ncbi:hypothetical protein KF707_06660 [Candidatus Obscuribacterales bacterium]|nr:hypothetical protein [Candidatus Obscuribacterales bacterium]MBX3135899.1 hypothetical protein [Candidatus Obscuribacterales bacterium]MBX3150610.1 hypothetical protein [Candidatus Obscuribacterales bacterium]
MSSDTPDASDLFQESLDAGEISPGSAALLNGLSTRINRTMAAPVVKPTVTEQTQLCMLIDNSPSMEFNDNDRAVIEGHNLVVNSLIGARAVNSIESLTILLNHSKLYTRHITGSEEQFRWSNLKAAPRLDRKGFIAGSGTPLYDRCLETLGSVIARTKWWEETYGIQTRSVTLLMTDGVNNEGRSTAADVAKVVKDMLAMEKHKIFFMGLQLDNEDFQKIGTEMGIPANCIDVVERDPRAIRSRFQLFSQSASAIASGGIKAAS